VGQGGCDRRPPQQRIEQRLTASERIAAGGIDLVMRKLPAKRGREPHHDRFSYDQPAGGGHVFAFTRDGRKIVHGWRKMEEIGKRG